MHRTPQLEGGDPVAEKREPGQNGLEDLWHTVPSVTAYTRHLIHDRAVALSEDRQAEVETTNRRAILAVNRVNKTVNYFAMESHPLIIRENSTTLGA